MCAMCICTQLPLARPPADPFAPQPVWSGRLTGNMVASRLPAAIMVRSKRSLDVAPTSFFSSLWWWNHNMSFSIVVWSLFGSDVWFWCLVLMFGSQKVNWASNIFRSSVNLVLFIQTTSLYLWKIARCRFCMKCGRRWTGQVCLSLWIVSHLIHQDLAAKLLCRHSLYRTTISSLDIVSHLSDLGFTLYHTCCQNWISSSTLYHTTMGSLGIVTPGPDRSTTGTSMYKHRCLTR